MGWEWEPKAHFFGLRNYCSIRSLYITGLHVNISLCAHRLWPIVAWGSKYEPERGVACITWPLLWKWEPSIFREWLEMQASNFARAISNVHAKFKVRTTMCYRYIYRQFQNLDRWSRDLGHGLWGSVFVVQITTDPEIQILNLIGRGLSIMTNYLNFGTVCIYLYNAWWYAL